MNKKENYQTTRTITNVTESDDWYEISQNGMCCGLKKKYGVKPIVGDKLTVHTKGSSFGTIRGMDLNGDVIFWFSDEELEIQRKEWLDANENKKQLKFKEKVAEMDEKYNNLPDIFKKRIDKFRANNDRFRIDYEDYEVFCCEQAFLIANACKTKEAVQEFKNKDWKDQIKEVDGLSDGHSGNTFGASCQLAYLYLDNPDNVIKLPGALSPLVGSKEYGDI